MVCTLCGIIGALFVLVAVRRGEGPPVDNADLKLTGLDPDQAPRTCFQ